jgi:hypothetical protein
MSLSLLSFTIVLALHALENASCDMVPRPKVLHLNQVVATIAE